MILNILQKHIIALNKKKYQEHKIIYHLYKSCLLQEWEKRGRSKILIGRRKIFKPLKISAIMFQWTVIQVTFLFHSETRGKLLSLLYISW